MNTIKVCKIYIYLLKGNHGNINQCYIVNCIRNHSGLVVQRFGISYIVAHSNAPRQKQYFTDGQTMVPPIVRTLFEFQVMLIFYLKDEGYMFVFVIIIYTRDDCLEQFMC